MFVCDAVVPFPLLLFYIHDVTTRPLGGRHAAVIPALPEEYDASTPLGSHQSEKEKDRRDSEDAAQSPMSQQQDLQPGLTQIVLPPPTNAEALNIQEYRPPAPQKEKEVVERRSARMGTRTTSPARSHRKMSPSSAQAAIDSHPPPHPRTHPRHTHSHSHHTRSVSQSNRRESGRQESPYTSTGASPPPVPATFASILNAYPAPPESASASQFARGTSESGGE
jgi:hypothetical protein